MEMRTIGRTGISASIFSFGGIVVMDTSTQEAKSIVQEAIELGVNYFDVAPSYGNAQNMLGPAIEPFRNQITLACKTGKRDGKGAMEELKNSLQVLKTDHFDIYQLHALTEPEEIDQALAPGGALEAIQEAKQQGLIRFIGFSSHGEKAAMTLLHSYDFDTILYPINWACMLKDGMGCQVLPEAAKRNMGRMALKALAYGRKEPEHDGYEKCWYRPILDNDALAELALRFTLSQDVHVAISPGDYRLFKLGISIIKKYNGNPPPLTEEELAVLKAYADKVDHRIFG